jgi:hypothetical protein
VFTLINTSIVNTLIVSSSRPNVIALDEDGSKKVGEKLRHVDLPIISLSPYSFAQ